GGKERGTAVVLGRGGGGRGGGRGSGGGARRARHRSRGVRTEPPPFRQDRRRPAALARRAAREGVRDDREQALAPERLVRAAYRDRTRRRLPRARRAMGIHGRRARLRRLARSAAPDRGRR